MERMKTRNTEEAQRIDVLKVVSKISLLLYTILLFFLLFFLLLLFLLLLLAN